MSNRRDFLKKAGGLALLTIVPRSVLGGTKFVAPSDQLTKGIIGVGGIGKSSYHFTSNDACRLVAVCDWASCSSICMTSLIRLESRIPLPYFPPSRPKRSCIP